MSVGIHNTLSRSAAAVRTGQTDTDSESVCERVRERERGRVKRIGDGEKMYSQKS